MRAGADSKSIAGPGFERPQGLNHSPAAGSYAGHGTGKPNIQKEISVNTQSHKLHSHKLAIAAALIALAAITGCSQKPTAEESAAQTQAIVDKAVAEAKQQFLADQAAEKAKQDAAAEQKAKEQAAAKAAEKAQREAAAARKERLARQRAAEQRAMANGGYPPPPPPGNVTVCTYCGTVTAINTVQTEGQGSGLGAIAGGLVGGLLGNQVGNGTGRELTTIAGAVGGAFAGNKIEKNAKQTTGYDIVVRMDTGGQRTIHQDTVPSLAIGQRVKIENGAVLPN